MLKTLRSAFLWTIGGLHFFMIFLIVGSGLIFFKGKTLFPLVRILARSQLRIAGLRLKVTGLNHVQKKKAYLMVGNHESLFDVFAIPAALPEHAVGIEAASHFNWPLWGFLTRRWGNVPLYRRDLPKAIEGLDRAAELLASGTSVVVLPEGHRTLTGQIGDFKKGPFHLARTVKADILPFVLCGLYQYNNKHSWQLNPGDARVVFGPPLAYHDYAHLTVDELSQIVKQKMHHMKVSSCSI